MQDIVETLIASVTPAELGAGARLALFVLVATELCKRIWRRVHLRFDYRDVWYMSAVMGLVGAWFLWPPDSGTAWWIAGLIVSGAVSYAHKWALIFIRWKFPALAAIITGDRRKSYQEPPGDDRRKPGAK